MFVPFEVFLCCAGQRGGVCHLFGWLCISSIVLSYCDAMFCFACANESGLKIPQKKNTLPSGVCKNIKALLLAGKETIGILEQAQTEE